MYTCILAVDIGTSSLKTALIKSSGEILSFARCRFPTEKRVPADWTDAFRETLSIVKPGNFLSGIVVSGNGPTLVSVDCSGKPGALLLWNDPVPDNGTAVSRAGAGSVAGESAESRSIFLPRISAFRSLFPRDYDSARWLFSGPEYLMYCLTGNAITILPEKRFEDAYWSQPELEAARLDPSKMPPFVLPGTVTGKTGANTVFAPALPAGIPVIAGGPDFIVALVGTGTLEPGTACDRAGTSEGLNVCIPEPVQDHLIRTLPSVLPGFWNASYLLPETGANFHAYRQESGQSLRPYPELMAEILSSPIIPKRGTLTHPGRAVVERIGFSVRSGIQVLHRATGLFPVFSLSGGQARNEIWNQMKADITGSTFALMSTPDGELMGDAVLGFYATGEFSGIREAARQMVKTVRIFEPDPVTHNLYSEKFGQYDNLFHT